MSSVSDHTRYKKKVECPRCGAAMNNIQVCHLRCPNCGAELTCSDKGSFW